MKQTKINKDWTDKADRRQIVAAANKLVDDLVFDIYQAKMPLHTRWQLTTKEIAFLYRFPLHVATNLFVERLLRVLSAGQGAYSQKIKKNIYFATTGEAISNYYYNQSINDSLLSSLNSILFAEPKSDSVSESSEKVRVFKKNHWLKEIISFLLKRVNNFLVKLRAPEEIAEYSNWAKQIFSRSNLYFFDYQGSSLLIDQAMRQSIKQTARSAFFKSNLDQPKSDSLADLYADFIDHVLPRAIVEGLAERFAHHEKLLTKWQPKTVNSFTGFCYNDNFKIFALLAKRKGASFVGYAHGISNCFAPAIKNLNELAFLNYYFAWGKEDGNWLKGDYNLNGLKIKSSGSVYLSSQLEWRKQSINPTKIQLLFPSGPLMQFMSDLEEISPEKNYQHRLKIIELLEELWRRWPGLKVLYKPFLGTYAADPMKKIIENKNYLGKIVLLTDHPATLYDKVDIVLWDTISTGFAESVQAGVPTLVFHNRFEYDQSLPLGQAINRQLADCGMLFYDVEAGLQMFSGLVKDLAGFVQKREAAVKQFQMALASPISKKEFRHKRRELLAQR